MNKNSFSKKNKFKFGALVKDYEFKNINNYQIENFTNNNS